MIGRTALEAPAQKAGVDGTAVVGQQVFAGRTGCLIFRETLALRKIKRNAAQAAAAGAINLVRLKQRFVKVASPQRGWLVHFFARPLHRFARPVRA